MNQVNQTAVVKAAWREKKLIMSKRVIPLTLKTTQMMSFLFYRLRRGICRRAASYNTPAQDKL